MQAFNSIRAPLATAVALLCASTAEACPFCNSNTAEQVREGIFNSDFGTNLAVAVAPFVILFAVLILILY